MIVVYDNIWHERFLDIAKNVSSWSKDPSSKIGAVFVDDKRNILSVGYNGFPRGIKDSQDRLEDREVKYKYVVHGEMNAIYNATYTGVCLDKSTLYVWGLPVCSECAKGIIQAGTSRVVLPASVLECDDRWKESWKLTESMFQESGVEVIVYHGYDS